MTNSNENLPTSDAAKRPQPVSSPKRDAQVSELIELTEDYEVRHGKLCGKSVIYVSMPTKHGTQFVAVEGEIFTQHLRSLGYKRLGRGPTDSVLKEVVQHILGRGFGLDPVPVYHRTANVNGKCYINRGPGTNGVVEIDGAGFRIVPEAPVMFVNDEATGILPVPIGGGVLEDLQKYFPSISNEQFPAFVGCLLACLLPEGAYPILCLVGGQDCAKSMSTEFFRALVDPSIAYDARSTLPSNTEDLFTVASSRHVSSFDNVSSLSLEISDALCRIATGSAYESRKLYMQNVVNAVRVHSPIILNGIALPVSRPDLLSRMVTIELSEIPSGARKGEQVLRAAFEADHAKLFGLICSAVSRALRDVASIQTNLVHRLTDAALFVTAAEPALGLQDGAIVSAWLASQRQELLELASVDPVGSFLGVASIGKPTVWTGSATDLLGEATRYCAIHSGYKLPSNFPKSPDVLGRHLTRNLNVLKNAGYAITKLPGRNDGRAWTISRLDTTPGSIDPPVKIVRPNPGGVPESMPLAVVSAEPSALRLAGAA